MNKQIAIRSTNDSPVAAATLPSALLQRKCACGGAPGLSGECAECQETRLQRKAATATQGNLAISEPGDALEREADRIADAVVNDGSAAISPSSSGAALQRQTLNEPGRLPADAKFPPDPGPSEEEKYKEAAKKIAEALRETKTGKELEAQAKQLGEKFLDSVEGKVITATAIGGALAAAIATNADLPDLPIPAIPLDFIKLGLKAKLTWQGPTRDPKNASLTLTAKSGVSVAATYKQTEGKEGKPGDERAGLTLTIPLGGSSEKKKPGSESDKYRAETARLQAEQAKFREGLKNPTEQAQDKAFWDMYWKSKMRDPLNPLALPLRPQESNEVKKEKKDEEPLSRKESVPGAPVGAVLPVVNQVLHASGQPLDAASRNFFSARLGHDFSHVHVHTDARADESARAVNALAYTVGQDIVFGFGQFQPDTHSGKQLLAHELVHVLQQSGKPGKATSSATLGVKSWPISNPSAPCFSDGHPSDGDVANTAAGMVLQRKPAGGGSRAAPFIKEVVVNQNTAQRVTATFSDGRTETDECSTGKGHCCFDQFSGTAEGGACSAARSTQVGNNCTPVGNFTVTTKLPVTSGGVELWTQFHDAKSVALHKYSPVNGTPLSHGCVRMHEPMAKTIFDGARVGVTRVKVEGLARPKCEDATLQGEWEGDFRTAGSKPPDGEKVDDFLGRKPTRAEIARERRNIKETRTEMKSALDVDDPGLDLEIQSWRGGAPISGKIPRCVPALTTEEQRVSEAQKAGLVTSGASTTNTAFGKALNRCRNSAAAEKLVRQTGEKLWQEATQAARAGGAGSDDRQLYWTRLMLTMALRQWNPSWAKDADSLRRLHARLLQLLEQTSRGMTTAALSKDPNVKRILISGFDPFGFPNMGDIRQGNLSGAVALSLDGEVLAERGVSAQIQAVVFPVRYQDFNLGIVENYLRPQLSAQPGPDLVMSISQGGANFELEEFAGRRRSTDQFQENLGVTAGSPNRPVEAPGIARGPEFIRTSVPATTLKSMRGALGRTAPLREETEVSDLPTGAKKPRVLPSGPSATPGQAVEGSGGGFLSNEIFYRNSLARLQSGVKVPMIHLHTPMLDPTASDTKRNNLIDTVRKILRAALPQL